MTWTTPKTWSSSTLSSSDLNTHVRDNLSDLNDRFRSAVTLKNILSSGSGGGTATAGAWQTLPLNTKIGDLDGVYTLSANQVVVPAGTYMTVFSQTFYSNYAQLRIYNVTDGAELVLGTSYGEFTGGTGGKVDGPLFGNGIFTIATSKTLEFQYQVSSTFATSGLGVGGGITWGNTVFTEWTLLRIA